MPATVCIFLNFLAPANDSLVKAGHASYSRESWRLPKTPVKASHASHGLFLAPAKDIAVETGHAN